MIHADSNDFQYYSSLDEIRSDGFMPIHVRSVLEFFTLAGRKTIFSKDNFIPIPDLQYVVLNGENRYYVRNVHKDWTLDAIYFYGRNASLFTEDCAIENLRRYVDARRVWLLYTIEMVKNTSEMLTRVYKSQLQGDGKLNYRLYLEIAGENLRLNSYKEDKKNDTGFKTQCKIQEDHIAELWKSAGKK
jgi:hypothetical protein